MSQYFTLLERDPVVGGLGRRRARFYFARRNINTPDERTRIVRASVWTVGEGSQALALQAQADDVAGRIARPRRRGSLRITIERAVQAMSAETGTVWEYSDVRSRLATRRSRRSGMRYGGSAIPFYDAPVGSVPPVAPRRSGYINSYSYKPVPEFRGAPDETPTPRSPFFGIELEIDAPDGGPDRQAVPGLVGDLFYCKEDGSLSHGVELVSHPGTLGYWNSKREALKDLFANLRAAGWKSHDAHTCGVHIHVSRAAFTNSLHLYRFLHLVYRFPRLTLLVSQRGSRERLNRWASLDGRQRAALKSKAGLPGGDDSFSNGRYEAVNMTRHTAEIRIFNGTLRLDRFYKNLQYAAAAVEYTREVTSLRRVNAAGFLAWLAGRTEYADLLSYLNDNDAAALTAAAA